MPLDDLRTFLDQPTLTLPVGGKKYTVRPCKADVWLKLQEIARRADDPDSDEPKVPDMELFKLALGDLFDQLLPVVTGPELKHIGTTAYLWQLGSTELAARFWAGGGKASTPTVTPTRTRRTTRTGEASTTRRRASGTTTSTRPKS